LFPKVTTVMFQSACISGSDLSKLAVGGGWGLVKFTFRQLLPTGRFSWYPRVDLHIEDVFWDFAPCGLVERGATSQKTAVRRHENLNITSDTLVLNVLARGNSPVARTRGRSRGVSSVAMSCRQCINTVQYVCAICHAMQTR
jgi:hypothetical protein